MVSEVIDRARSRGSFLNETVSPSLPGSTPRVDVRCVEFVPSEGPSAAPGRRQGKGLEKNVLGTRPRRCNRKACQITVSQNYECMETQET